MARKSNSTAQLSEAEVWNIVEYMDGLYRDIIQSGFSYYSPDIENANLKNLVDNPKIATAEEVRRSQANWKNSENELQEISMFMQYWDGLYNKAIRYYCNLLSWDWSYYCTNAENDDYNSDEYKSDLKKVYEFFNNFKLKQEGGSIIKNCLLFDTYYTWLRKSALGYTLQMMPQDYCKITGSSAVSKFLWDFNLTYFYNSNVNIENYDSSLIKAFSVAIDNGDIKSFANRKGELNRTTRSANQWVRTKVSSGAWCWKFNQDSFITTPPLTSILKNLFDNDTIQNLQKDKDMLTANEFLWGEMKTKKDELIGSSKNAFTVDAKQVGQLLHYAKKGIDKNMKLLALPLENTRIAQFTDNNSLMSANYLKSSANQVAFGGEYIYSSGNMAQEAIRNALKLDYEWVSAIYKQMEQFLDYFVNKETDTYKFKFNVGGSTLYWLRKENEESLGKIIDRGIVPNISKIAQTWGIEPQALTAMMKEMKYGDSINDLQLLLNSNTSKDGSGDSTLTDNTGGRPTTNDNDATEQNREYV